MKPKTSRPSNPAMPSNRLQLTRDRPDGRPYTPGNILKVNHAGEFGAVNIYRAQILIGSLYRAHHLPLLRQFLEHEKRHLEIFGAELERRGIPRCRSFLLCGFGGFVLGFLSALLGRKAVMACTAAVETVVLRHLEEQLVALEAVGDRQAYEAVEAIVEDEREHRDHGASEPTDCVFYRPFTIIISAATEAVIWTGMRI